MGYIKTTSINVDRHIEILAPILIACLGILGMKYSAFTYAALLFCLLLVLFYDETFNLSLLFFMVPIATIFKTSFGGTSFFTYIELMFVVCHFMKSKDLKNQVSIILLALGIYIVFIECIVGIFDVKRTIKFISNMLLLGIIVETNIEAEYERLFKYYIIGFILSGVIGRFGAAVLPLEQFINTKISYYNDGSQIYRFAGMYTDPNYFAINLIICSILTIYLYALRRINVIEFSLYLCAIVFFIAMTGSKSALIMLVIPVITYLWLNMKQRKYLIQIVGCLFLLIIISLVQEGKLALFDSILRRFTVDNKAGINQLTTGRYNIWNRYYDYFKANPIKVLMGNGVGVFLLEGSATHNTYIDLIYQLGIIGTSLYITYIIILLNRKRSETRKNLANYSIWICILIMYFFLSQFQEFDLPFQLGLAILCINLNLVKTNTDETIANKRNEMKCKYIL